MKRMIWIWIAATILGVLAAHLIANVAAAQETTILKGSPLVPPPEFDHPFTGVLTVERVAGRVNVERICKTPRAVGCAFRYTVGGCHLIILDDYSLTHQLITEMTYAQIYRHEVAHCNGWAWNHPMEEKPLPEGTLAVPIKELTPFELRWAGERDARHTYPPVPLPRLR